MDRNQSLCNISKSLLEIEQKFFELELEIKILKSAYKTFGIVFGLISTFTFLFVLISKL
jgi:hypothetical protein